MTTEPIPSSGRLAGIDYGEVRVGIALCDPSQTWVTPYATHHRSDSRRDAEYFRDLAECESVIGWVVGLPIHCDGQESQKSAAARQFARQLEANTGLPVTFFDERFTSAQARRLMAVTGLSSHQKKKRVDQIAAYLILSHFLESRDKHSGSEPLDDSPL